MKRVYNFAVTIEHPIVKGHMVYEENLLPGLAYIDMLYHLAQDSLGLNYRQHCLKRLSIYQPLIVRENCPVELEILFDRVSDHWKIAVQGTEADGHGNSLERLYITAELHEESIQFEEQIDIEGIKQAATQCVDMEEIYGAARKRGLVHQGMIKARGNVYLTDLGCLIEVNVEDAYREEVPKVLFHPSLIDGAGMAAGFLAGKSDSENNKDLYIPLYYESFTSIEPLYTHCYARVNLSSLRKVNDVRTMDIAFFNAAGKQVAQLNGITEKRIRFKEQINSNLKKETVLFPVQKDSVSTVHPQYSREGAISHIERRLQKIFSKHLKQAPSQIDINTGFFEIGLESSQLLAIVQDIERSFGLSLSPTLLFENNNIRELIDYLKIKKQENNIHSDPVEKLDNKYMPLENKLELQSHAYEFYEHEPFLQDHLVYGQPALMGVTHCCLVLEDYIRNNLEAYPVELRNIKFVGGPVTLKKTESAHVLVQFGDDDNQENFKTVYYLKDPNNAKLCCQGEYIGSSKALPETIDIESLLTQSKVVAKDTIDKSYNAISNFAIGEMLQTINSAFVYDDSTVIAKVCLSDKLKKGNVSRFILDPLLLNSCYQLCYLENNEKKDNIFIPLMIEGLTVFRSMPETAYIVRTLRYRKNDFISFDAMMLTEDGEIIAEMINASVKEVVNPALLSNASLSSTPVQSSVKTVTEHESDTQGIDIAIIGINGRYPGAKNIQEFWQNLKEGRDSITEIPKDRWDWQEFYTTDRTKPGHIYSKWGGFIEDIDRFDPLFFNISPREAEILDPQERLFLEHCWLALEDAGYTKEELQKAENSLPGQVGVYVGVMHNEYPLYARQRYGVGTGISSIANRVSYYFDFHGPSIAIDTMCSSSLTSIYMACQALKEKQINAALAGGVNVSVHPNKYLLLSQGQFISSKGHCESFGEGGDGYIPGEGVGVLVLKRLADAKRDNDNIYAVIKGAAINHGGRASGFTVPNQKAQSRVIRDALQAAHTNPRTISYLEAHGTGTSLGDPIEITGLTKAFQEYTKDKQYCAIGSAKSNIGHCESAAGIAGITKVLLQLKHRQLAPSLHSKTLNPNIDFAGTPFIVQQELAEWKRPVVTIDGETREYPRIAGISSFGAGGSNAHMVIEEYIPAQEKPKMIINSHNPAFIVLSAKNEECLKKQVQQFLAAVQNQQFSDADLADIAYTLQVGREAMEERLAITAVSLQELEEKLQGYLDNQDNKDDFYRGQVKRNKESLAIFRADEDLQKAIEAWITKGKYVQLLDLWVKGLSFDWSKLYGNVKPRRISLPTYPFARERYWLPEMETKSTLSTTSATKASFVADNHYVQREICYLKKQWELCLATPTRKLNRVIAILTTPETKELAVQLSKHFPKSKIFNLYDLESQLQQPEDWKVYDGCVDLTGCSKEKNELPDWMVLLQQLIEYGKREDLMLLCVTKGMESFHNTCLNLSGASRTGLYRMLQSEYRHLRSRHMDGDPFIDDIALAQQIASEFLIDNEDSEVCYKDGKRYRAFLQEDQYREAKKPPLQFPEDHVLLITGGTRGIGSLCAQHFVANYGVRRLVLMGREIMPPREEWDSYQQQNTSTAQKIQAIRDLEAQGAKVQVLSVSLSDDDAMQHSLQEIKDSLGPIGGIIHCAGLGDLENPAFIRKSLDGIKQVLNPKVTGLDILYENCKSEPLQFFVLFSSISAIIPSLAVGQSDYAMANAYLDYFAEAHTTPTCPIVSIQWPSWKETGMGEAKSKAYEQTGLRSLTDKEGLQFLDSILLGQTGSVIMPAVINPNLWKPHQLMQRRIQEEVSMIIKSRNPIDSDSSSDLDTLVKDTQTWLMELFSQELKIKPSQMDIDTPFPDYGIDSILLTQILQQINRRLTEKLDPSIILEYSTIESLAMWLAKNYRASLFKAKVVTTSGEATLPIQDFTSNLFTSSTPEQPPAQEIPKVVPQNKAVNSSDIAVIGLSCRFPGANTLEEYWQLLSEGRSVIRSVSQERWGYTNHFHAGLLDNITHFDSSFFLIPQEDAKVMDPQALMVLEESLKLWYHAGYSHKEIKGKSVGVYLGARSQHQPDQVNLRQARNPIVAAGQNYLAANISQFFDLRGPSLVVDTACSSALVGMHMAIQALRSGEIDAALVGGVSLLTTDAAHRMFQQRGILSQDPVFHIFDKRANGVVLGEGIGLVLLKTVEQAVADGDHIYAVIKALTINNDGRTAGPATPNLQAQKDVMQAALAKSGKLPQEISYVEANGSGSEVTDLLELKAIQSVYRPISTSPLGLGSIKPNIGHPLCAEGIASFIKVVMMLHYRQVVPFLSGEQPMNHYDLETSPFYFCRHTDSIDTPYTAAINCFADGGTNVHLILETWEDLVLRQIKRNVLPPPALSRYNVQGAKILKLPIPQIDKSNENLSKKPNNWVKDPAFGHLQTINNTVNIWKQIAAEGKESAGTIFFK
jgi:acyl transferase domain-containing protein/acyl carrier protein/NAD(P)-dependent dehydrogenase (short-subunit alcohol dehydrogenase family)